MRTRTRAVTDAGGAFADKRLTLYAVLTASALMGALFGALCWCFGSGELSRLLDSARQSFLLQRSSGELAQLLTGTLAGTGIFLLAALLLGFSAIAQPFELALPFLRGTICGVILAGVSGGELTKQSAICTAAVLPGVLISLVITILASREAMYLSDRLFRVCFYGMTADGIFERIKLYAVRFVVLLAALTAGALLDCGLSVLILNADT